MFTMKKYPQSIFGAVVDGFRLYGISFPRLWYLLVGCAFAFCVFYLSELLLIELIKDLMINNLFVTYGVEVVSFGLSLIFSCFLGGLICIRIHVVAVDSHVRIKDSVKLVFKKTIPLVGTYLIPLVMFFGAVSVLPKIVENPIVLGLSMVVVLLIFIYLSISLFFSPYIILIDNRKFFQTIKYGFRYVNKNFRHLFFVLFIFFIIDFAMLVEAFLPKNTTYMMNDFFGWVENPYLRSIGYFIKLSIVEFFYLLLNAVCMSVFYNLKAREGLTYDQVT